MSNHTRVDRFTQKMGNFMDRIDNEIQMLVDTWNDHDAGMRAWTAMAITPTIVTSGSSYAAASKDCLIVINKTVGSATAVTLPASPISGRLAIVKDGKGDGAANNITITAAVGNIDGAASKTISSNYGVMQFVYNGTQWNVLSAS